MLAKAEAHPIESGMTLPVDLQSSVSSICATHKLVAPAFGCIVLRMGEGSPGSQGDVAGARGVLALQAWIEAKPFFGPCLPTTQACHKQK